MAKKDTNKKSTSKSRSTVKLTKEEQKQLEIAKKHIYYPKWERKLPILCFECRERSPNKRLLPILLDSKCLTDIVYYVIIILSQMDKHSEHSKENNYEERLF